MDAVWVVARSELRRRWAGLLLIGVVAGLVAGTVLATAGLARRTATAYDRLASATAIDDARATAFGSHLAGQLAASREVTRSWVAPLLVARVEGRGVTYVSILGGPPKPPGLFSPVLVRGRAADPDVPGEVVVTEDLAGTGVSVGQELPVRFLAPEEVRQFDTGFGEPDGPSLVLRVTGVVRVPGGHQGAPLLGGRALAEQYRSWAAGEVAFLRLRHGARSLPALRADARRLSDAAPPVAGAEEFPPLDIGTATEARPTVAATARVLVAGLGAFALVAVLAGLLVVGQALGRHFALGAAEHPVEAALGMTSGERVFARLLPATSAAALAGVVPAGTAVAASGIEPPGAVRRFEPHPGMAVNVAGVVLGAVLAFAVVLLLAAVTARRAARPRDAAGLRRSGGGATPIGPPPVAAGIGFALARRGRGPVPVRSTLAGTAVGVLGVTGVLVFSANLTTLQDQPDRYGWQADLLVADAGPGTARDLAADPQVQDLALMRSSTARIAGQEVAVNAVVPQRGDVGWTLLDGRAPAGDSEMALGPRLAARLGVGIGDEVVAEGRRTGETRLQVVGTAIGPSGDQERLGDSALLSPVAFAAVRREAPFTEALVTVAPGLDAGDVASSLGDRYEVQVREPPAEVRNLLELGRLPEALGAFLALVAVLGLTHALLLTTRRRRRELAVLRAVGFTPGQAGGTVATMALTTAAVALVVGVPLGIALGRVIWSAVADANALAPEPGVPAAEVVLLTVLVPAVALVASLVPVRRAARLRPAPALRAE